MTSFFCGRNMSALCRIVSNSKQAAAIAFNKQFPVESETDTIYVCEGDNTYKIELTKTSWSVKTCVAIGIR